ncbi:MAG: rhodanese-related sulfurtransferase [Planctomycetota bacterium]|jgi:rhodanese-related sulfurtransferase
MPESPALPSIELDELLERIALGHTLVDVLPAESYAAGHLPGALHLPLEALTEHAASRLPEKSQELVLYCAKDT